MFKLVLVAAVLATMVAEGMRVSPSDLGLVWKSPGKLARGFLAVVVLVPIVAVLTVVLVRPSLPVTAGLSFLAASPLAPLVLTKLARSGEDFRLAASLHVALAALSIVTAPVVILVLGRVLGFPTRVAPPGLIAARVFFSLLLPFGVGVALRAAAPDLATRIRNGLETVGLLVILVAFAVIVVRGRASFHEFGVRDYAALTLFCVLSLASGHFSARRDNERTTYALESAARNPGVALFMATSSFGPVRGAVLLPYLAVFILASTVYSATRKRTLGHRAERMSAA